MLAALSMSACRGEAPPSPTVAPVPSASASATPIDRLGPGELEPGTETAYGLVLPRGFKIVARPSGALHAQGKMPPEDVANYVRTRVIVSHVELGAARTIFPSARIKTGDPNRTYRIEIVSTGRSDTLVEFHDVTPPKATQGLSNAQRLEQVGLTPDGKLANPNKLH